MQTAGIFKLTNLRNVEDAYFGHRYPEPPTWLEAELSQEEAGKLIPISEAIAAETPASYAIRGHSTDNLNGLYSPEVLGYLSPSKVRRYFVRELAKELEGAPKLAVSLDFSGDWKDNRIGRYEFFHTDRLSPTSTAPHKFDVLTGHVLVGDQPETAYIIEDISGRFIPIISDKIVSLIRNAVKRTEERGIIRIFWEQDIEKAEKLAKSGGFPDLVEEANVARRRCEELDAAYPEKHLEWLRQKSIFTGSPRYRAELSGDLQQAWERGTKEYSSLTRAFIRNRKGEGGLNCYPFSLESLSTLSVIDLMKHFAQEGHTLDYIQEHMKLERIG